MLMKNHLQAMIVAGLAIASSTAVNADLLYRFTFEGQDDPVRLTSVGSLKTTAKVREIDGQKIEFVKDTPAKEKYSCKFILDPRFERGAMLVLPESAKELPCAKTGDKMTVAMWVKWGGTTREASGLASKSNTNQTSGWMFRIMKDGKLSFASCGGYGSRNSTAQVEKDKWTHVAVTWDVGNPQGVIMYINGVNAGISLDYVGTDGSKENTEKIRLGVQTPEQYLPLNGSIHDVRLYNEVLTPDAITQLAKETVPATEK